MFYKVFPIVINPIDTNLSSYELGKGESKEHVSIMNSSVEKILKNTSDLAKRNVQKIQDFAKEIDSLHRYQQIKDAIEASDLSEGMKATLNLTVEKLKNKRNVTLN